MASVDGQHPPRLRLIGEFGLWVDGEVLMPHSVQRVLAFLALARAPVGRLRLSGALWGEASQERADGNLRSTLWRLGRLRARIVERTSDCLAIAPGVQVDIWDLSASADRILAPGSSLHDPTAATHLAWASEILPGWDDPWLVIERERYRQLRLHALERSSERLLERGDVARAIEFGLTIVDAEPYRESAHRLLVAAYLQEGNVIEAVRQYRAYRRLTLDELGVEPSPLMEALVEPIRAAVR